MGTIGHHTLLFDLKNWQLRAAIRGYYRQQRPYYESARLLGLWTVSCQRSSDAPALSLQDLVEFPWDNNSENIIDKEDEEALAKLLEEARQHNASIQKD